MGKLRDFRKRVAFELSWILPIDSLVHRFTRGRMVAAKLARKQPHFVRLVKMVGKREVPFKPTSHWKLTSIHIMANGYNRAAGDYYYHKGKKEIRSPSFVNAAAEIAADLRFALRELAMTDFEIFEKVDKNLKTRADRERFIDDVLNESLAAFQLPFKAEQLKEKAPKK